MHIASCVFPLCISTITDTEFAWSPGHTSYDFSPARAASQKYCRIRSPASPHGWTQVRFDCRLWPPLGLDGASTFIESSVGADALQTCRYWTNARMALQAAHTAVGVQRVGKGLPLLHVGVRVWEVTWDDHGYGVLQLLSTLVPKTGAHGLEVQNFGVNITQTSACCSSTATSNPTSSTTPGWRRGSRSWVYRAMDVSPSLTIMSEKSPLLGISFLILRVHGHEPQHSQVEEGSDHSEAG